MLLKTNRSKKKTGDTKEKRKTFLPSNEELSGKIPGKP